MWKKPENKTDLETGSEDFNQPSVATLVTSHHEIPKVEQSTIGRSVLVKGDLTGEGNMLIQGRVEGTVYLQDNSLKVGRTGKVIANVFAHSICVEGELKGDAYATKQVVVSKTGKVCGNIISQSVVVEDGALLRGSIDMDPATIKKHFPKAQETQPKAAAPSKVAVQKNEKIVTVSGLKESQAAATKLPQSKTQTGSDTKI